MDHAMRQKIFVQIFLVCLFQRVMGVAFAELLYFFSVAGLWLVLVIDREVLCVVYVKNHPHQEHWC